MVGIVPRLPVGDCLRAGQLPTTIATIGIRPWVGCHGSGSGMFHSWLRRVLTAAFAGFRPFNLKLSHLCCPRERCARAHVSYQIGNASANL
jgi:hypothetical protein